jgi:hypothetical protein
MQDVYTRITGIIVSALEESVRPWVTPWNADHAPGHFAAVTSQRPTAHRDQHSVFVGVGHRAELLRTDLDDLAPHSRILRCGADPINIVRKGPHVGERRVCPIGQPLKTGADTVLRDWATPFSGMAALGEPSVSPIEPFLGITKMETPTMRSIGTMRCYALMIVFALLVMPTRAVALTFTIVDVPGAEAAGISPQGDIVGFYVAGTENHGFLLDKHGILVTIDVPGASVTRARGISPQGDIVGFYIVGAASHSFLLHEGTFIVIDVPGAPVTRARSISPRGDIVGFYGAPGAPTHGFLLNTDGTFTTVDFPGASSTQAFGVNARGDIVGSYVAAGATHAFLLAKDGTFTTMDVPGASVTQAFGINPRGDVVGSYVAAGTTHGFLLDTKGTFTIIDVPGASFTEALAINARGDIVGRYSAGGTFHGFLAQ